MLLGDITNPEDAKDWWYILLAILIVDVVVIFLAKYLPDILGESINLWYERFGLNAVISDVLIIAIGFFIARYAYTHFMPASYGFNLWYFLAILVLVQLVHDLFFYVAIIKPIPQGHNRMIDVFKRYSSGGVKILLSDAAMMIASALIAMSLKEGGPEVYAGVSLLTVYTLPYILETKNKFSEF
jgi:hypothetical protein